MRIKGAFYGDGAKSQALFARAPSIKFSSLRIDNCGKGWICLGADNSEDAVLERITIDIGVLKTLVGFVEMNGTFREFNKISAAILSAAMVDCSSSSQVLAAAKEVQSAVRSFWKLILS